jgi:hypothetical protein
VSRRVLRFLWLRRHRGTDRDQVNVHAASQQGSFVDNPLSPQTGLRTLRAKLPLQESRTS